MGKVSIGNPWPPYQRGCGIYDPLLERSGIYSAGKKIRTFKAMNFLWPPWERGANFEHGGVWNDLFLNFCLLFGRDIFIIRVAMLDRLKGPSDNQNCTFLNFP